MLHFARFLLLTIKLLRIICLGLIRHTGRHVPLQPIAVLVEDDLGISRNYFTPVNHLLLQGQRREEGRVAVHHLEHRRAFSIAASLLHLFVNL